MFLAAKRLIGRDFDDPEVQRDIKSLPFAVIQENDYTKIRIRYRGETKTLYPEEISGAVLEKMKHTAEAYLGVEIKDVVLTVPAFFNNSQRVTTKTAAEIAGLNVLRIIYEPTAAALAYGMSDNNGRKNVLVFDLGANTFDVSILTIKGKECKVCSIKGDSHFGGADFDQRMVDFFVGEVKRKHKHAISVNDNKALKSSCENAKIKLSYATNAEVVLGFLRGTISGTISRDRFEGLCNDLFEKMIRMVDEVMQDAEMSKEDIEKVILVGNSTRIPRVQELLQDYFNGKELHQSINPDECIAYGAAVQAALLQSNLSGQDLSLCDVYPSSLGIELIGGRMKALITRKSPIPTQVFASFQAAKDYTTTVTIKIYEGKRYLCENNTFLGVFDLCGFPSRKFDPTTKIDVTFQVNANRILIVTAIEPKSRVRKTISIDLKQRLNTDATDTIDVHALEEIDKNQIESMDDFERYCCKLKREVESMRKINEKDKRAVELKCDQLLSWLDAVRDQAKRLVGNKRSEIETLWQSILEEYI